MKTNKKVIYLDYSATTPVNAEVLAIFNEISLNYIGNPNSHHQLGVKASNLINEASKEISQILNIKPNELIYTSGASEANNLAIKGIAEKYAVQGKHIITTRFEHSSVYAPLTYLEKKGYEVDFVRTDENGMIDLDHLKSLLREDTILVSIASVNSEIGLRQPIQKIGKLLKAYPNCCFHVDMTQSIGKEKISLANLDLASFSAHKFFGLKGIGILVKKENLGLEPLIHGGKSTTIYRSGTPMTALIASLAKALDLATEDLENKQKQIREYNQYLKAELSKYDRVRINSNDYSLPHILNISVLGTEPEAFQKALEEYGIYISTQTACHTGSSSSLSVMALTNDQARAASSLRISLASITTEAEINQFLKAFAKCYQKLSLVR